jgi:prefoldin subunit 5
MQLKALAKAEEWHQQALAEKDQQIAELQARLERFENKND